MGRFVSPDPLGQKPGLNVYAYAGGDPLNQIDPLGLTTGSLSGAPTSAWSLIQSAANFVYNNPLLAVAILGTEVVGGGPEDPVADAAVAGEIALARGGATAAEGAVTALEAPAVGTVQAWSGSITAGAVPEGGMTAFRVWGGESAQAGSWLSPVAPESASAARSLLALPAENSAAFISEVTIPAGTQIQFGTAASAFGQAGGGIQIQLLERIPLSNFGPGVPLP
jgi:hypothetical protein